MPFVSPTFPFDCSKECPQLMSPLLLQPCHSSQPVPVAAECTGSGCPDVSGRRCCSCTDERNHEPDARQELPQANVLLQSLRATSLSMILAGKEKWEERHFIPACGVQQRCGWGMCSRCLLSPRPSSVVSGEFKYLSHLELPCPQQKLCSLLSHLEITWGSNVVLSFPADLC